MRVLCESVGFLSENGRFSLRIDGEFRRGSAGDFGILDARSVVFDSR